MVTALILEEYVFEGEQYREEDKDKVFVANIGDKDMMV